MKKGLFLLIFQCAWNFSSAQHSPYFYNSASPESQGITDDIHAYYLKRFFFRPYISDDRDEKDAKNIIKKKEHEFVEFNGNGNIYFTAYFEQPLKFYYDRYLSDPKKVKSDWDYTPDWEAKDYTNYAYHPNMADKTSKVLGACVYVLKVDGVRAATFYSLMAKNAFSRSTEFMNTLWVVDLDKKWDKKKDDYREPTLEEKYADMRKSDDYFPLMYYMRDHGTPGSHKVEIEVYPASLKAKTTADHTDELLCKGEFTLTLAAKDIQELKEAGGPKNEEEVNTTTTGGFFRKL